MESPRRSRYLIITELIFPVAYTILRVLNNAQMIDTIKITIQGSRCEAFGNLIRAALQNGAVGFPNSTVKNLMTNTHVEVIENSKPPKMAR